MPLRPALAAIHPRGPVPREVRQVRCPGCGHGFHVPQSAFSARCPQCTRYLAFKDVTVRQRIEGDVSTMGHVCLQADSEMMGKLVCGQFTNEGRFEGQATIYGPAVLGGGSLTTGRITASSLRIINTATARLRIDIRPAPRMAAAASHINTRPLRQVMPRLTTAARPHANIPQPLPMHAVR